MEPEINAVLKSIDLGHLINNFHSNNVSVNEATHLSDDQLKSLGVSTIGQRIQFRERIKEIEKSGSSRHRDVMSLFRTQRRTSQNRRQPIKARTWTGNFFCFAETESCKCPDSTIKTVLQNAGLGSKKIQFQITDNAEVVTNRLKAEYSKLMDCGGFELLRCLPNTRNLSILECNWDAHSLRSVVGTQARIYVRPIQKSIDISESVIVHHENITEKCMHCSQLVDVRDLRDHFDQCGSNLQSNDQIITGVVDEVNQGIDIQGFHSTIPSVLQHTQPLGMDDSLIAVPVNIQFPESLDVLTSLPLQEQIESPKEDTSTDNISSVVEMVVAFCRENNISDPVQILKIYQQHIVTGRDLEISTETETTGIEGSTNFILVDRNDIMRTSLEEIRNLKDLRLCLDVNFYGETAVDFGGPRKEFFTSVLQAMQKEYFDPVREWSGDYETIGQLMALSTLQNGKLPRVLTPELVEEVFYSEIPRKCISDLRNGLDSLGICKLVKELPTVVHLFTPTQPTPLTLKRITSTLNPRFSEEGSNRRRRENNAYSSFIKYLREAASGRRDGVSLEGVMKFSTGTDEEPVLGFVMQPSIRFVESSSFIPTANTCVNTLNITIPFDNSEIPKQEDLFKFFDYAFCNTYFGLQ